ncbi:hypothetical protein PORY_001168 [Pneumocystis oryctolagi]|uniref:Uncharacterized protein n=1 Tax=Pneumocystis oryctolagi TaxID=42067 RepID=A0ACB7CCX5_9ASCO|nr:hypothetical protein PORY_001168 [Pneumocystis oryctolagi]
MNTEDFGISQGGNNVYRPYYVSSGFPYVSGQGVDQNTEIRKISMDKNWTELEYLDYFDFECKKKMFIELFRNAFIRYLCVFAVQPFETAKTILQCQYHVKPKQKEDAEEKNEFSENEKYDEFDENESIASSSKSDPPYFYEPDSFTISPNTSYDLKKSIVDREGYVLTPPSNYEIQFPWEINVQTTNVRSVIWALWDKEGFFGLWKAQNITFIHSILYSAIESWSSSFLSSAFSFPDFFPETIDSNYWIRSFFISLTSSVFTSLLLAPVDAAKTRYIGSPDSIIRNIT